MKTEIFPKKSISILKKITTLKIKTAPPPATSLTDDYVLIFFFFISKNFYFYSFIVLQS